MKLQEIKKIDEEDDGEDEVPLHKLVKLSIRHSLKRNWKKEEEEKEKKGESCAGMMNELK